MIGRTPFRIALHDYAGYPFTLQLAESLADRGHRVLYAYSASFLSPNIRGGFSDLSGTSVRVVPVYLEKAIRKEAFVSRWFREVTYGRRLRKTVSGFAPDVVISANAPLESQAILRRWSASSDVRFVYWLQDLYGVAAQRLLQRRLPPVVGSLVGLYYRRLERRLIRHSDAAVLITDDFREALDGDLGRGPDLHVIPNWAPLQQTPPRPRKNSWAMERGLTDGVNFVYAGTLGMKHDPSLLLKLARAVDARHGRVVVVSEGTGAEWLADQARKGQVSNLTILPFQPAERLPEVLGSGDILVALLEPEAGEFSVPSKILTYLCAARPILASLPAGNLAARVVKEAGCGAVVEPGDDTGLLREAERLMKDRERRVAWGAAGRRYAEQHFDIETIADRFETVLLARSREENA